MLSVLITVAGLLAVMAGALPCWLPYCASWVSGAAANWTGKGFAIRGRMTACKSEITANYGESHAISRHTVGNTAD